MKYAGVLTAVDAVVNHLKSLSRNVTTPEEIAQVGCRLFFSLIAFGIGIFVVRVV